MRQSRLTRPRPTPSRRRCRRARQHGERGVLMADRRADDTPLAPRRSLAGPSRAGGVQRRHGQATADASGCPPPVAARRQRGAVRRPRPARSSPVDLGRQRPGPAASPARRCPAGRDSGRDHVAASPAPRPARPRGTRRARLRLVHLDPWSVMKTSFLLSIAFGIVTVVAVAVVWSVLGAAGVWDSINQTVSDVLGGDSAQNFDVQNYVGTSRVLGFTMIVGGRRRGADHRDLDARRVPLQPRRGPARRHRGHPRGGRALSLGLRSRPTASPGLGAADAMG